MKEAEKIHIHKVCQQQKCTYDTVYHKYSEHIDSKGFIPVDVLKSVKR